MLSAMALHVRASCLDPSVALAVPAFAATITDMQSVLIFGGNGLTLSITEMAHNSAAAAVSSVLQLSHHWQ